MLTASVIFGLILQGKGPSENTRKHYLKKYFVVNKHAKIKYSKIQSDEGGRFFHSQNKYVVVQIDENEKIKINNKEQSLVSYFIPAATKGSFKIREYSKEVYELLIGSINHDSYNHGNQRLIKELPMEQVMGYIIHLLDVASENDNTNLTLSKELLSDCLVPPISHAINEFVFSINT
mgnify:CR=1 FL=1